MLNAGLEWNNKNKSHYSQSLSSLKSGVQALERVTTITMLLSSAISFHTSFKKSKISSSSPQMIVEKEFTSNFNFLSSSLSQNLFNAGERDFSRSG